jgi:digeranylgeranylglycerophospholipid reductase
VYDAVVVGAGPSGGMAARQLASAGFRTVVLEKKRVVGEPVQCAEGVSEFGLASNGLRPREEWVAHRVSGAKCVVPNGKWFYITRLPGYAIDRASFDRWLVNGAVDDGAQLRTSTKVTGISRHDDVWRVEANGETIDTRIVIGADGPASFVARQAGLVRSLERIGAYEYRFRREDVPLLDPEFFLLYIGEAYDGGYAWIFPKGDSVNVGAGGHIDAHAATVAFCRKFAIDVERRTQTIAGSIPSRYDLTALAAPGLAIAGDAAGITNPLNGAGIHPGIFSGRIAGEIAVKALERENPAAMVAYDRAMRASPFLDPLLFWMIDRIRGWSDRLMNSVGEELDGLDWRAVNPRMILSVLLRKPWLGIHAREFYRMILALELCDRYGW